MDCYGKYNFNMNHVFVKRKCQLSVAAMKVMINNLSLFSNTHKSKRLKM